MKEKHNRPVDPLSARLEFYSAGDRVDTIELSKKALEVIRSADIATRPGGEKEVLELRHYFSLPVSLDVDRLVYDLALMQPGSREMHGKTEVPLLRYEQKTKLRGCLSLLPGNIRNDTPSLMPLGRT